MKTSLTAGSLAALALACTAMPATPQTMAHLCPTLERHQADVRWVPEPDERILAAVIPALGRLHLGALTEPLRPVANPVLDSLVGEDSLGVERALAAILQDSDEFAAIKAVLAVAPYRKVSGHAPLMLANPDDHLRRYLRLSAIVDTLTPIEEELVYTYACDAAWLLTRLTADSSYFARYRSDSVGLPWVRPAWRVLEEARRLLRGARRNDVEGLIRLLPEFL